MSYSGSGDVTDSPSFVCMRSGFTEALLCVPCTTLGTCSRTSLRFGFGVIVIAVILLAGVSVMLGVLIVNASIEKLSTTGMGIGVGGRGI